MATISVLMGIYNCASTLEEAVSCIQAQSYTDWELIMCDDGSADNTLAAAQQLAAQDTRIKVLCNDHNMGRAATLNRCLGEAKGKYVARMDGRWAIDAEPVATPKHATTLTALRYPFRYLE